MSEAPFRPLPADRHPVPASSSLETQLEIVLERDGVPISVAPPARVRRQPLPAAHQAEADRIQVQIVQGARTSKRPRRVSISYGDHEPSRFTVRMQGIVARPQRDVRDPFHRSMHRWQTPYVEGVGLERVLVHVSDLWIEALEPSFFHDQFTPGEFDEALRESRRGVWSRVRQPFVRWHDRRPEAASISAVGSPHFSPEGREAVTPAERGDAPTARLASAIRPDSEGAHAATPEIEAMPISASEPLMRRSPVREAWSRWREGAQDAVADAHELEREVVQEVEAAWQAPHLEPKIRVTRVLIGFLGMLCLVALPAGAVSWSRSVVRSIRSVQDSASALSASGFDPANGGPRVASLHQIQSFAQDFERSHGLALSLAQALPTTRATAETVEALLEGGQDAAKAGALLSQGFDRAMQEQGGYPSERLVRLKKYLDEARPHLDRVFAAAERIHPETLPANAQGRATEIKELLLAYRPLLAQADGLLALALSAVGHAEPRTYLILFQNPGELRPSGGFMGSYAQVVLDRGAIRKLDVPGGGPYDLRSQLLSRWEPPQPLQLVGARWEFQDANWDPDFGKTAEIVRRFWSRSGQPTLDGILAVNASLLPKLLTITGPIEMPAYGKTVTSDNVLFETQKAVELEYDREKNQPKAFIGDLNREVLRRLQALPNDRWPEVARVAAEALETKEIQVHLSRPEEQEIARSFGWTGEWPEADAFDSLAVIGANIAGQKTNQAIRETVRQTVRINERGAIETDVALERAHTAAPGTLFQGANNVEYLRLYAPAGATLLQASGFEAPASALFERPTDSEEPFPGLATRTVPLVAGNETIDQLEEAGRTVFGGWLQLRPGQSRTTTFRYALPRTTADMARALADQASLASTGEVTDAYVLGLTSQSGAPRAQQVTVFYPPTWKLVRPSAAWRVVAPGELRLEIEALTQDQRFSVLFSRPTEP